MQIRFSNFQPSNMLGQIDFDITTEKFSFVYKSIRFESDSWTPEKALYGELIFHPKYPEIEYSDDFILALKKDLSAQCKCKVETTDSSFNKIGKTKNTDFWGLVKEARKNSDF